MISRPTSCNTPSIDVWNPPSSSPSPQSRNDVWTSVPNFILGSSRSSQPRKVESLFSKRARIFSAASLLSTTHQSFLRVVFGWRENPGHPWKRNKALVCSLCHWNFHPFSVSGDHCLDPCAGRKAGHAERTVEEVAVTTAAGIFQPLATHDERDCVMKFQRSSAKPGLRAQVGSRWLEIMDPSVMRTTFEIRSAFCINPVRFRPIQIDDTNIFFGGDIANEKLAFGFIEDIEPFNIRSAFKVLRGEKIWFLARATREALWP